MIATMSAHSPYEHLSGLLEIDKIGLGWLADVTVLESVRAVSTRPHSHPHAEIIYCLRGAFSYRIDGIGDVSLGAGMGLVIPARTRHSLLNNVDAPGKRLGFHLMRRMSASRAFSVFTPDDYDGFYATILSKAGRPFRMPSPMAVSIRRLAEFARPQRALASQECGLVRILCCSILYDTAATLSLPLATARPNLMEEAVKYLEEHHAEDIRIADLARYIGYGRARLFELFKRHTGLAPNDYLMRFRVRKAQELLAATTLPAREVARRVGIADPGYFSSMFKRLTGRSPSACRGTR